MNVFDRSDSLAFGGVRWMLCRLLLNLTKDAKISDNYDRVEPWEIGSIEVDKYLSKFSSEYGKPKDWRNRMDEVYMIRRLFGLMLGLGLRKHRLIILDLIEYMERIDE